MTLKSDGQLQLMLVTSSHSSDDWVLAGIACSKESELKARPFYSHGQ
jgi:hypothetical protein